MNAFWSGTDNANENATQFYGVWGEIFKDEPNFLFRWVEGTRKINIDPSFLFDIPQVEIKTTVTRTLPYAGAEPIVEEKFEYEAFKGPWENVEYPEDWMPQHKKRVYTPKKNYAAGGYGGGTYGAGGNYWDRQGGYGGYGGYGQAGGQQKALPSGSEDLDNYFGYDAYDGYGLTQGTQEQVGATKQSYQKKNGANGAGNPTTKVEIYIEDDLVDVPTAEEVEKQVLYICEELIADGFDYMMSESLLDTQADYVEDDETKTS